jgi:hypothetical protein
MSETVYLTSSRFPAKIGRNTDRGMEVYCPKSSHSYFAVDGRLEPVSLTVLYTVQIDIE